MTGPRDRDYDALTARELEVLQTIADGHGNESAAVVLHISVETVKAHVKHILAKMEASHRTHAVALGFRRGLIS